MFAGRLAPVVLGVTGGFVLLYAVGGGCGAALPYPDPTPELLAMQSRQIHAAQVDAGIGAGLMLAGGMWWLLFRPLPSGLSKTSR